jgi:glycosyltransferase involved in cell wall biosynthesis
LGIVHDLRVFWLARSGRYDIIGVKDKFLSGVAALIAARLHGARFVYWLSWPFPEDYLARARDRAARYRVLYLIRGLVFRYILYRILLRYSDHVLVQSEQMKRDVATNGVSLEKMTAVPMGVRIQPLPAGANEQRKFIPKGSRCFLYLGSLEKVRRLDFLIRVLALVRDVFPEVRLYVVGKGDYPNDEQQLTDEARRLHQLDALVMVGQLPQAEAFAYVLEADLCVSPFYPTPILNSTSPTKLIEYMALGKAVVANDHPEQRLVIEESGAGLCVPYDETAFADAIVKLLRNKDLADEMGRRGRSYAVERRSYGVIANAVETVLLSTAGKANAQASIAPETRST